MNPIGSSNLTVWVAGLAETVLAYAVFTVLQRHLNRFRLLKTVALQLNLLALAMFAMLFMSPLLVQLHRHVLAGVEAAALFLVVAIGLRVLDGLFFIQNPPQEKQE